MKHSEQQKTTTILNFEKWINEWDLNIKSYDHRDNFKSQIEKCEGSISIINKLLSDSDDKSMRGKQQEEAVKAMFENQNKKWYKDLTRISKFLLSFSFDLEKMNENNYRKTDEIFKLRSEISQLKTKLNEKGLQT